MSGCGRMLAALALAAILSAGSPCRAAAPAANAGDVDGRFYSLALASPGLWDGEKINQISRAMPGLPAEVACPVLWMCASLPPRVDDLPVYSAALRSQSPVVRRHAVAIMLAKGDADHRRILMGVVSGSDVDLARYALDGLAQRHVTAAVPEFIQILHHPHIGMEVKEATAQHLRRLTGAAMAADPLAWRKWWEENRHLFE